MSVGRDVCVSLSVVEHATPQVLIWKQGGVWFGVELGKFASSWTCVIPTKLGMTNC